jgi:transposase
MRMGATHFLTKTLPKVATEMALCVLIYNLTRILNIVGVEKMIEAITAWVGERQSGLAGRV